MQRALVHMLRFADETARGRVLRVQPEDMLAVVQPGITREALNLALRLYRPDLILYQAGVDVHQADELGYLSLSDAGVRQRDAMVFDCAISNGLPIAAVPGGGYRRDWRQLIPLHLSLFEEAKKRYG